MSNFWAHDLQVQLVNADGWDIVNVVQSKTTTEIDDARMWFYVEALEDGFATHLYFYYKALNSNTVYFRICPFDQGMPGLILKGTVIKHDLPVSMLVSNNFF